MSLPDHIFCAGPATREQLLDWSMKAEKLSIAGALRFTVVKAPAYAPDAPIFLALPFDGQVARQMVEAARNVRERRFLVKDHPMTPFNFAEGENLHRTEKPLGEQEAVSAVVFAATTVGLEALIAGLPTFRFLPRGCIALDILPQDMNCLTVEAESLEARFLRRNQERKSSGNGFSAKSTGPSGARHCNESQGKNQKRPTLYRGLGAISLGCHGRGHGFLRFPLAGH
jgi:hypothetical protein